ncbi:MAG: AraC family transcriptional regulator [Polyangia bacterium]
MHAAPHAPVEPIPLSVPGLRAVRSRSEAPYFGLKEVFSICRFESGRSEFWTHGRVWPGRPGSVVIHQPGDVHRDVSRDGPITYQVIALPPAVVEPAVEKVRVFSCLAADDPRGAVFQRLHDAVAARADRLALECALAEAIGALDAVAERRCEHTRPVRRALALLRERLSEAVTLDELAAYAGLDKFHLCRAFRAQVGLPPHAYLTRLRILHAKRLLSAGTPPRDVAAQVGLYDQSQLNRHFRRITGMTPGQFARSV